MMMFWKYLSVSFAIALSSRTAAVVVEASHVPDSQPTNVVEGTSHLDEHVRRTLLEKKPYFESDHYKVVHNDDYYNYYHYDDYQSYAKGKGKGMSMSMMSKGKGKGMSMMSKGKGKGMSMMSKGKGKGMSMMSAKGKGKGGECFSWVVHPTDHKRIWWRPTSTTHVDICFVLLPFVLRVCVRSKKVLHGETRLSTSTRWRHGRRH